MEGAEVMAMALSSFEEALTMLELAHAILEKTKCEKMQGDRIKANCVHATGRTLRYLGRYEESEKTLNSALAMWKGMHGKEAGPEVGFMFRYSFAFI